MFMDSKYVLGIDELDSQHESIERVCIALRDSVADQEHWRSLLDELYDKMRFHFYAEESVMAIFSYPETQDHRRSHLDILRQIDVYRNRVLSAADIEALKDRPMQLLQEQILTQDMRFAAFLTRNRERFGIQ
jgi:hemerythrin